MQRTAEGIPLPHEWASLASPRLRCLLTTLTDAALIVNFADKSPQLSSGIGLELFDSHNFELRTWRTHSSEIGYHAVTDGVNVIRIRCQLDLKERSHLLNDSELVHFWVVTHHVIRNQPKKTGAVRQYTRTVLASFLALQPRPRFCFGKRRFCLTDCACLR